MKKLTLLEALILLCRIQNIPHEDVSSIVFQDESQYKVDYTLFGKIGTYYCNLRVHRDRIL